MKNKKIFNIFNKIGHYFQIALTIIVTLIIVIYLEI
jgi:hypothetical protein